MARGVNKKRYARRTWLNQDPSKHARVVAVVEPNEEDEYVNVEATLDIADCSRNITLDFSVYVGRWEETERDTARYTTNVKRGRADARAALRKLSVLQDELDAFREKLEEAYREKGLIE